MREADKSGSKSMAERMGENSNYPRNESDITERWRRQTIVSSCRRRLLEAQKRKRAPDENLAVSYTPGMCLLVLLPVGLSGGSRQESGLLFIVLCIFTDTICS